MKKSNHAVYRVLSGTDIHVAAVLSGAVRVSGTVVTIRHCIRLGDPERTAICADIHPEQFLRDCGK